MTAINITDLNNAKTDVDHIREVATSEQLTATDRLGHTKDTLAGAIHRIGGFNSRGAWVALAAYSAKDLVSQGGTWYVCVVAHTSSAAFATDSASKWRVYQGITSGDLSAASGSSLVGNLQSGTSAVARTVQDKLRDFMSVFDFMSASQIANVRAGLATVDVTTAIQAAITALVAAGGGALYFPPGTYLISGTLAVTGLTKARIFGEGVIKRTSSGTPAANTPALTLTSCSDVTVSLRFYMSQSTTTSINLGVTVTSCVRMKFLDCVFDECAYGILASTGNTDFTIEGCSGTTAATGHAVGNAGGLAFIYGFGAMTRTYIGRCTASGFNHLVLCDGDTDWTVNDCRITDTGDSAIYIRGDRHTVKNCRVERAGKDGIKIVPYVDNTLGNHNLITGCYVKGAGYTKSDGGNCFILEGNYSQITNCECELVGPTTASLASSSECGVVVGGKNVVASGITIKGPGVSATGGATTGVLVIGTRQASSGVLVENVRAESLRYVFTISDTGTFDIGDVEFKDVWGKTCDALGFVNDADQRIKRVKITGGGVDGTTGHGLDLGNMVAGVTIHGAHFKNIAATKFCIVQRDSTLGRYTNCTTEGAPLPVANVSGSSASRQIDNDWQYTSTGQPVLVSANFVGDRYWRTAPAAGGSPGSVCVTAGNPGTFKNMAAIAA